MAFNILKHTKPLEAEFDSVRKEILLAKAVVNQEIKKVKQSNESTDRSLNLTIQDQSLINSSLSGQIQTILNEPDAPPPTEYYVPITGAYIFGDGQTEGDWKIVVTGTKLSFQRLESSIWIEKGIFS